MLHFKPKLPIYQIMMMLWLVALIIMGIFEHKKLTQTPPLFDVAPILSEDTPAVFLKSDISNTTASVHSATLAHITINQKNRLMSAWFEGSKEGAKDVQIYASFLELDNPALSKPIHQEAPHLWSAPTVILNRHLLAKQSHTYIKKLGNPVLYQSKDGTIHLFVVATSYAGWAASKIYHLTSKTGDAFMFKQVLPLSPFLNVSHLVRATPIALQDGGFYLPIYHEMMNKFEVLLRFDRDGHLIAKIKPNHLRNVLQPSVIAISEQECLSVRRHRYSEPLLVQHCHQGGLSWQEPIASTINNDNSSLNIITIKDEYFVIHNQNKGDNSRHSLWLSKLNQTTPTYQIQPKLLLDKSDDGGVSYPTTMVVGNHLHVVYTYDRKSIQHLMMPINDITPIINEPSTKAHCLSPADAHTSTNSPTIMTTTTCQEPSS